MYIYNISKKNILFYSNFKNNFSFHEKKKEIIFSKFNSLCSLKVFLNFFLFFYFYQFIKKNIFKKFLILFKSLKSFNFFKLKKKKFIFKKYDINLLLNNKKV